MISGLHNKEAAFRKKMCNTEALLLNCITAVRESVWNCVDLICSSWSSVMQDKHAF